MIDTDKLVETITKLKLKLDTDGRNIDRLYTQYDDEHDRYILLAYRSGSLVFREVM